MADSKPIVPAVVEEALLETARAMRAEGRPITEETLTDALLERYRSNEAVMRELVRVAIEPDVEKYLEEMVAEGRLTRTLDENGVPLYRRVDRTR
jgi:hypothetical protein